MTDTTGRPPVREVMRESLAKAWPREGPDAADTILADLTTAGYPVEALPALVEALEAAIPHLREHTICTAMRVDGNTTECQAHDDAVRALVLAREPKP